MQQQTFLAFDLGAESGRAILGLLRDRKIRLREMARFPNGMLMLLGSWRWNVFRLYEEMIRALKRCSVDSSVLPSSMGVDTWGVDFGLLGSDGSLLGLPYAYRDARTQGIMEKVFARFPRDRVYALTGIQFLRFNSLFQLYAMRQAESPLLRQAQDLLFMPDLFHYFLTGKKATEFSYATTSQLFNPATRAWEPELFSLLDLPLSMMQPVTEPGTVIGVLRPDLARETGLGEIPVVAVATHDTASAVAAVPAEGRGWSYISSGTWSLMGIEVDAPIIDDRARELNFTNEGGVAGTFRFLKNITGLWLLQASRRVWNDADSATYGDLEKSAEEAAAFRSLVDPDDEAFLNPRDMPHAIREYCRRSRQAVPDTVPAVVRCILESLALKYRYVLDQLRSLSPQPIERIHIIGGGSRNRMLCQFTANACGLPVIAGPAEATAAGNILVQALSQEEVEDLSDIRRIVRRSFRLTAYEPQDTGDWNNAFDRFSYLLTGG